MFESILARAMPMQPRAPDHEAAACGWTVSTASRDQTNDQSSDQPRFARSQSRRRRRSPYPSGYRTLVLLDHEQAINIVGYDTDEREVAVREFLRMAAGATDRIDMTNQTPGTFCWRRWVVSCRWSQMRTLIGPGITAAFLECQADHALLQLIRVDRSVAWVAPAEPWNPATIFTADVAELFDSD